MARLYGGAHEISGISAPLWLCGWVVLGSREWDQWWGGRVWCGWGRDGLWLHVDRWWVGVVLNGLTWGGD